MRNRALIARWCAAQTDAVRLVVREQNHACMNSAESEQARPKGKTFLQIVDYDELRGLFARLLAEIQRIKSEGDYEAARQLVETYAVTVDPELHNEVLERYQRLDLAPYKGFINPWLLPVYDAEGGIADIQVNYSESYDHQMLRYSAEYGTLV